MKYSIISIYFVDRMRSLSIIIYNLILSTSPNSIWPRSWKTKLFLKLIVSIFLHKNFTVWFAQLAEREVSWCEPAAPFSLSK